MSKDFKVSNLNCFNPMICANLSKSLTLSEPFFNSNSPTSLISNSNKCKDFWHKKLLTSALLITWEQSNSLSWGLFTHYKMFSHLPSLHLSDANSTSPA